MRALLDINVIIALLDPDHVFHDRAHQWWKSNSNNGWASCPLTENGAVRIMSNPAYSKSVRIPPADIIQRLDQFANQTDHQFWPDDLSIRNHKAFAQDRLLSSRTITDVYLVALAVKHNGNLATFDQTIPVSAVIGATEANLQAV